MTRDRHASRIARFPVVLVLLACAVPVNAKDLAARSGALSAVSAIAPSRNAGEADGGGAGGVTFGRAEDLVGAPLYLAPPARPASRLPAPNGAAGLASLPFAMPAGMPVAARALTSGFGWRQHPLLNQRRAHLGVDLAAPFGSPIFATSPGIVSAGGWYGGYGSLVVLDHGQGVQTLYGHMSQRNVVVGQRVQRGDVIGYVGSTGLSTGPHLHYEVRVGARPVDPIATLSAGSNAVRH